MRISFVSHCFTLLHLSIGQRRFLNCQDGGKKPGRSLLKVGVVEALNDAGFDETTFLGRGGIFEWTRDQKAEEPLDW